MENKTIFIKEIYKFLNAEQEIVGRNQELSPTLTGVVPKVSIKEF